MTWAEEQERFWAWINRPADLSQDATAIAALLAPHSHISQAEALSIYNNAYHQRLVDVSSALFPVLFNTLGKELYTQLWIAYMGAHPPRNGPIHRVGESLPAFVRAHPSFAALPAVADIAQLETLLGSLFDKADEPAYTLAQLQALAPEAWPTMTWQAKQDWALFYSRFDLEDYWRHMQAFTDAAGEPGEPAFVITPLPSSATHKQPNYLVFRQHYRMQFQHMRPELAVFLQGVQDRHSFAAICQSLAESFPEQDIASLSLRLLLRAIELELLLAPQDAATSQTLS